MLQRGRQDNADATLRRPDRCASDARCRPTAASRSPRPARVDRRRSWPTQIERAQAATCVDVEPLVTDEIDYLSADEEERYVIAQANAPLNEDSTFTEERVIGRATASEFLSEPAERVDYMDVSPKQIVSAWRRALIPFLEHDDANRALMGSNMQRQAVPLLKPEAPLVGTGMEVPRRARLGPGGRVAKADGVVDRVTGERDRGPRRRGRASATLPAAKFMRSNQGTCINQRPIVDARPARARRASRWPTRSSTEQGELALGQNVLVAFMRWEGGNFEDAILLSERLVRDDMFTSIHIEKHEVEARDTKLGPEEITRDIPNVGEDSLRDLDENGIIHVGAEVKPGDILVGKITPKGETELTAEERLLRAIFGEKAREVKDTCCACRTASAARWSTSRSSSRDDDAELPAGRQPDGARLRSPRSARSRRATRWPGATATRA